MLFYTGGGLSLGDVDEFNGSLYEDQTKKTERISLRRLGMNTRVDIERVNSIELRNKGRNT